MYIVLHISTVQTVRPIKFLFHTLELTNVTLRELTSVQIKLIGKNSDNLGGRQAVTCNATFCALYFHFNLVLTEINASYFKM